MKQCTICCYTHNAAFWGAMSPQPYLEWRTSWHWFSRPMYHALRTLFSICTCGELLVRSIFALTIYVSDAGVSMSNCDSRQQPTHALYFTMKFASEWLYDSEWVTEPSEVVHFDFVPANGVHHVWRGPKLRTGKGSDGLHLMYLLLLSTVLPIVKAWAQPPYSSSNPISNGAKGRAQALYPMLPHESINIETQPQVQC